MKSFSSENNYVITNYNELVEKLNKFYDSGCPLLLRGRGGLLEELLDYTFYFSGSEPEIKNLNFKRYKPKDKSTVPVVEVYLDLEEGLAVFQPKKYRSIHLGSISLNQLKRGASGTKLIAACKPGLEGLMDLISEQLMPQGFVCSKFFEMDCFEEAFKKKIAQNRKKVFREIEEVFQKLSIPAGLGNEMALENFNSYLKMLENLDRVPLELIPENVRYRHVRVLADWWPAEIFGENVPFGWTVRHLWPYFEELYPKELYPDFLEELKKN